MRTIFLLLFAFSSLFGFSQLSPQQRIDSTANGKILADFIMTDINGDTVHFYDFKEDIIVFDLWATWCGPCRQQAPVFDSLRHAFAKDTAVSIRFISISIDKSNFKWKRYVKTEAALRSEKDHFFVGEDKQHIAYFLCTYYTRVNGQKATGEGIPQYVIIGKDHEILERDASQPQTGKLDDEIKNLITKYKN